MSVIRYVAVITWLLIFYPSQGEIIRTDPGRDVTFKIHLDSHESLNNSEIQIVHTGVEGQSGITKTTYLCALGEDPVFTLKNPTNITKSYELMLGQDENSSYLAIRLLSVALRDAGNYTIKVIQESKSLNRTDTVYIFQPPDKPSVTGVLSKGKWFEGEIIKLICDDIKLNSLPSGLQLKLRYLWYKNDALRPETSKDINFPITRNDHNAKFSCRVGEEGSNITSEHSSDVKLQVYYVSDVTMAISSNGQMLVCDAVCNPPCNYVWLNSKGKNISFNAELDIMSATEGNMTADFADVLTCSVFIEGLPPKDVTQTFHFINDEQLTGKETLLALSVLFGIFGTAALGAVIFIVVTCCKLPRYKTAETMTDDVINEEITNANANVAENNRSSSGGSEELSEYVQPVAYSHNLAQLNASPPLPGQRDQPTVSSMELRYHPGNEPEPDYDDPHNYINQPTRLPSVRNTMDFINEEDEEFYDITSPGEPADQAVVMEGGVSDPVSPTGGRSSDQTLDVTERARLRPGHYKNVLPPSVSGVSPQRHPDTPAFDPLVKRNELKHISAGPADLRELLRTAGKKSRESIFESVIMSEKL